jgi:hypothetical protein
MWISADESETMEVGFSISRALNSCTMEAIASSEFPVKISWKHFIEIKYDTSGSITDPSRPRACDGLFWLGYFSGPECP